MGHLESTCRLALDPQETFVSCRAWTTLCIPTTPKFMARLFVNGPKYSACNAFFTGRRTADPSCKNHCISFWLEDKEKFLALSCLKSPLFKATSVMAAKISKSPSQDTASQTPAACLTKGGGFLGGGILTGTFPTLTVGGNFASGAFRIPFCISPTSSLIFSWRWSAAHCR